jgi:hypothetical protein
MQATQPVLITKRDLEDIVANSVDVGVGRAFTRLGIDHEDPIEMQADFRHLRASRETIRAIKTHSLKVVTTAVVGALVAYLAIGFAIGDNGSANPALTQDEIGRAIVELAKKKYEQH